MDHVCSTDIPGCELSALHAIHFFSKLRPTNSGYLRKEIIPKCYFHKLMLIAIYVITQLVGMITIQIRNTPKPREQLEGCGKS